MTVPGAPIPAGLARIRLLSLDVDGVQTDGGLYYTESGEELRKFHVRDGMGIQMLMAAGVHVAVITASATPCIAQRGRRLGVRHTLTGVHDKLEALTTLCRSLDVDLADVAHMADDVNDLAVLRAVGFPIAVADAQPEVLAVACHVTNRAGGQAPVREICDQILAARAAQAAVG